MPLLEKCIYLTKTGKQCKKIAATGFSYCNIHIARTYNGKVRAIRKLSRSKIIELVKKNSNIAHGLDLTFSDISGEILESSEVPMPNMSGVILGKYGAILSGVTAYNTIFQHTKLTGAKLTYGNFSNANFYKCDLREADLRFANFDGASLSGAKLQSANLCGSRFNNTNFRNTDLSDSDIYLAKFSGETYLSIESFKRGYILQEDYQKYKEFIIKYILPNSLSTLEQHLEDRYLKASMIYRQLRIHFAENGKVDDSRWAFLRERRMARKATGRKSLQELRRNNFRGGIGALLNWISDWIAELLCNYGESIWRVIFWFCFLLFFAGPLLITIAGGLLWSKNAINFYNGLEAPIMRYLYIYFQHVLYTLDTLTTSNYSLLSPANELVRLISSLFSLSGIFLAGLLGFVAGNRIRKI